MESYNIGCGKIIGEKLYYSQKDCNGLFCADLRTNQNVLLWRFCDEPFMMGKLHRRCIYYDNQFFFLPDCGSHIHIWNIKENRGSAIGVSGIDREKGRFVYNYIQRGEYVHYYSMTNDADLVLNMKQHTVDYNYDFVNWRKRTFGESDRLSARMIEFGGRLCVPIFNTGKLVFWDMEKQDGEIVETGLEHLRFIAADRVHIWLTQTDTDHIYCMKPGETPMLAYGDEEDTIQKPTFSQLIPYQGSLYAIPRQFTHPIVKVEITGKKAKAILIGQKLTEEEKSYWPFDFDVNSTGMYIFMGGGNGVFRIGSDGVELEHISFNIEDPESREYSSAQRLWKRFDQEQIVTESGEQGIRELKCMLTELGAI